MKAERIIGLSNKNGLAFIKEDDIIFCKANGNYTIVYLTEGRQLISSRKLKVIEERLGAINFFRIHHSHLININHLMNFKNGLEQKVVMSNGEELEVAKRKKAAFFAKFLQL